MKAFIAPTFLFVAFISANATAQSVNPGLAPIPQEITENNVDIISGNLSLSEEDIKIGRDVREGAISLSRNYRMIDDGQTGYASFGSWEHSFKVYAIDPIDPASGYFYEADIIYDGKVHSFRNNGVGGYDNLRGDGSSLVITGSSPNRILIFTSAYGDNVNFKENLSCSYVTYCALASEATKANGVKTYFSYESIYWPYYNSTYSTYRLKSISNSYGYGMIFSYVDGNTAYSNTQNQLTVSSVQVGATPCADSVLSCSFDNLATISYSYISVNGRNKLVRADGGDATLRYEYNSSGRLSAIYKGSNPSPSQLYSIVANNNWCNGCSASQYIVSSFQDSSANIINYTWQDSNGLKNNIISRPGIGQKLITAYGSSSLSADRLGGPLLKDVTDELGGKTQYQYDSLNRTNKIIYPELGSVTLSRDGRGNILEKRFQANPNKPSADIVEAASFSAGCTAGQEKICNRPVWVKDARGGQTDYTYDATHGGMLSEMAPPPSSGGARPLKLWTYTQRYPWFMNSSGTFVQANAPIWVKASETQCQTSSGASPSATCDTNAPMTTTTYEYGATGNRDALLVKGVAVTSAAGTTLRTCFTYNLYGQRLSETAPRAMSNACL